MNAERMVPLFLICCFVVFFSGGPRIQGQLPGEPLTNHDIVRMVKAKVPPQEIVGKIKTSRCHFDTNRTVLAELQSMGVPVLVIQAMLEAPFGSPNRSDGPVVISAPDVPARSPDVPTRTIVSGREPLRKSPTKRQQGRASGAANTSAEEIAKRILPSVVLIVCEDNEGHGSFGSGFFINASGNSVVVTNYHVIEGMVRGRIRASPQGKKETWRVDSILNYNEQSDLAVLGLDYITPPGGDPNLIPKVTPLQLAASSLSVKPGQIIYAFGNPEGLVGTISQGIVSAAPRNFKEGTRIQISAPISPGSSGGPVVNATGDVIGIAQEYNEEGQNLNFAVPASYLAELLSQGTFIPNYDQWRRAEDQRIDPRDWLWLPAFPQSSQARVNESNPTTGPTSVASTEWLLVAHSKTAAIYYKPSSVVQTPSGTLKVWTKDIPTPDALEETRRDYAKREPDNRLSFRYYSFAFTLTLFEINCRSKESAMLTYIDYDTSNDVLDSYQDEKNPEWKSIVPDSLLDGVRKAVCR